jgi:A/G-specific adenine glycosylase
VKIAFRQRLLSWYRTNARDLPWRRSRDPYRIWVSEIMLQQTRVAAVVPYYERFLLSFPDVRSLAMAEESGVLSAWSGLGYYSRARNLQQAAREIVQLGRFPSDYESIRNLPGIGPYTAAAVASIAFGLPHAVVDGNVRRVLSRIACGETSPAILADELLDRGQPGDFNQALMELGATLCVPRQPKCDVCPVASLCEARRQGRQEEFPPPKPKPLKVAVAVTLLIAERKGRLLVKVRRGFRELPEAGELPGVRIGPGLGRFRHSIMNRNYIVTVRETRLTHAPQGFCWSPEDAPGQAPLSTMARKALALRVRKSAPRAH